MDEEAGLSANAVRRRGGTPAGSAGAALPDARPAPALPPAAPCARCASLPRLSVRYRLRYSVLASAQDPALLQPYSGPALFWRGLRGLARRSAAACAAACARCARRGSGQAPPAPAPAPRVTVLDVEGVLRPGRSLLVLGAPHGAASAWLRLLAGRLPLPPGSALALGGLSPAALRAVGLDPRRLIAYVAPEEALEPLLTVRETLAFAAACLAPAAATATAAAPSSCLPARCARRLGCNCSSCGALETAAVAGGAAAAPPPPFCDACASPQSVAAQLDALGMGAAADTRIGSAMDRGCSGGERRRVTVGEATLSGEARLLCCDGVTSGLDGGTALRLVARLLQRAAASGAAAIFSLQSPTIEVVNLFDDVSLLCADGREMYHGPVAGLRAHLTALGFAQPRHLALADWASEVVTHPLAAAAASLADRADACARGDGEAVLATAAAVAAADGLPLPSLLSADALSAAWRASAAVRAAPPSSPAPCGDLGGVSTGGASASGRRHRRCHCHCFCWRPQPPLAGDMVAAVRAAGGGWALDAGAAARWRPAAAGCCGQLRRLLPRQWRLLVRNHRYLAAKLISGVAMGLIVGTAALGGSGSLQQRVGVILFSCIYVGFSNNAEVPVTLHSRLVVYKQTDAALYGECAYVAAVTVAALPAQVLAVLLFGSLIYWLTGFAANAASYFFFLLTLLLIDLLLASVFRLMMLVGETQERASAVGLLLISVWLLCGGVFLIQSEMPVWLAWLVYLSPYFWAVVAIANEEFHAPKYAAPTGGGGSGPPLGQAFMETYALPYSRAAQWLGLLYIVVLWLLLGWLAAPAALRTFRYGDAAMAPRPPAGGGGLLERLVAGEAGADLVASLPGAPAPAPAPVLAPLTPPAAAAAAATRGVALAFSGLRFTVRVAGGERVLLRDVVGGCPPASVTALMGASGAGKTTLLDVLAARKTTGSVAGQVWLGGAPATRAAVAAACGFAEQEDVHLPTATVAEALAFSAALRAPGAGPAAARARALRAVAAALELDALLPRAVASLARGERKRLTLAVELAAAPALLACDEPTSFLEAADAHVVMRALRRVAAAGITVVCSIHQPPADVFFAFDRLILLAPGGWLAYAGAVGHRAETVLAHFESLRGADLHFSREAGANVATWLLTVTGAGVDAPPPLPVTAPPAATLAAAAAPAAPAVASPAWLAAQFDASPAGEDNRALVRELMRRRPPGVAAAATAGLHGATAATFDDDDNGDRSHRRRPRAAHSFASAIGRACAALGLVCLRTTRDHWRAAEYQLTRFLVTLFQSLLLGILFMDVDFATYSGTLSALGLFLVAPGYISILYLSASITLRFERREVLYRELAAGFYAPEAWALAAVVGDLPYAIVTCLVAVAILYWIVGLAPSAASFFFFYLATTILAVFYMTTGVAYAAFFPTLPVAQIVGGLTISISFLFAGLLLPGSSLPPFWIGLYYAVPTSHVLRAIGLDQLCACDGPSCPLIAVVDTTGATILQTQCAFAEAFLGTTASQKWVELGWATLAIAVMLAIALLATRFCNYQRK